MFRVERFLDAWQVVRREQLKGSEHPAIVIVAEYTEELPAKMLAGILNIQLAQGVLM